MIIQYHIYKYICLHLHMLYIIIRPLEEDSVRLRLGSTWDAEKGLGTEAKAGETLESGTETEDFNRLFIVDFINVM